MRHLLTVVASIGSMTLGAFGCSGADPSATSDAARPAQAGEAARPLIQPLRVAPPPAAPGADAGTCVEPGRWWVTRDVAFDTKDILAWQRAVDPAKRTQADGASYCASLRIAHERGWRLPTIQELQTLLLDPIGLKDHPGTCMPSIDQAAFPDTPADMFWSSTVNAQSGDGLFTEFDDGRTHPSPVDEPMFVRCVHDLRADAARPAATGAVTE